MESIILSPLLEVIFDRLANPVLQMADGMLNFKDHIKKLQDVLPMAQAAIQRAEERQMTDRHVKYLLQELKDAALEAEDLVEKLVSRPGSVAWIWEGLQNPKIILENLQGAVDKLLNLVSVGSSVGGRPFEKTETSSSVVRSEVYGREEEKRKLIEMLSMPSVITIFGIPGIGKTTLAQMIYNDDEVDRRFDLRIWVSAPLDFNAKNVIKAAIHTATENTCDLTELEALRSKLEKALKNKKYLLVLDDVWIEDLEEWDKLRSVLLSSGVDGSRVLVTTRNEKVARLIGSSDSAYHLKGLFERDLWALFKNQAFCNQEEEEKYQSLLAFGKEIVRKCQGVPLAAKVIGRQLRLKREEKDWLHVQNSELWDLRGFKDGIFPALVLSYLLLPQHLKHCFAFCSIFPKDYDIERHKLIQMWMAHGFILSDGGSKTVEEIGDEYFKELMWMSVFEEVNYFEGGSTGGYKMNDVFHSLARFITEEEYVTLEEGLAQGKLKRVYHASITSIYGSSLIPEALHEAERLRTLLIYSGGGLQNLPPVIFEKFIYLRMLSFRGSPQTLQVFLAPYSILKYLDLSNGHFSYLPYTVSDLTALETLNLSGCYNLRRLPRMDGITGLRHLDISGCEALVDMPEGFEKLFHLQTLPIYIVPGPDKRLEPLERRRQLRQRQRRRQLLERERQRQRQHQRQRHVFRGGPPRSSLRGWTFFRDGSIMELKNLDLRGELKIKHLERVLRKEAEAANLMDKEHLHSLGLCWDDAGANFIMNPDVESNAARFQERKQHEEGPSGDSEPTVSPPPPGDSEPTVPPPDLACEVLERLHPHKNLKKLYIAGYPGVMFPRWTLPNLTDMVLINCGGCSYLPILGHLPLLRSLRLEGIKSITHIGPDIYGGDVEVSFPSLQELFMTDFPVLQEWGRNPDGKNSFPKLRKLILNGCPNLNSMPNFASLEHLELHRCSSILLNCMEDLTSLSTLVIHELDELLCLPIKLIRNNRLLKHVRISSCPKLRSFTSEFRNLASLTSLSIRWCEDLTLLSEEFKNLTSLEVLEIVDCSRVETLPEDLMGSLKSLQDLSIENCNGLEMISFGSQPLTALKHLTIMYCPGLAALPGNLEILSGLLSLTVISCPLIEYLPEGIMKLKNLGSLEIRSCPGLKDLPEWLESLASSLTTLKISDCHNLKSLPIAMASLTKLQQLTIQDCPDLQSLCQDGGKDWWKVSRVPHRRIFSSEPQ